MPINKETIISVFDEKLTLMQWLKTINKALEDAVLTGVEITKKGNATLSFKFTFEDGTFLETNDIVLQQGESVNGAYIQNGHLYLTLTNSQTLDAGNVKPVSSFSIDANQHLIVNYGDGTSQDLGAIFNGNVNINGNFTANSIVENMTGYGGSVTAKENLTNNVIYASCVKTGNKITFVYFASLTRTGTISGFTLLFNFAIPSSVGEKLYPFAVGGTSNLLDYKKVGLIKKSDASFLDINARIYKSSNTQINVMASSGALDGLELNVEYLMRYEVTFLLNDSLLQ